MSESSDQLPSLCDWLSRYARWLYGSNSVQRLTGLGQFNYEAAIHAVYWPSDEPGFDQHNSSCLLIFASHRVALDSHDSIKLLQHKDGCINYNKQSLYHNILSIVEL